MQETKTRASQDEDPPAPRPAWVRIVAIAVALAMLAGFVIAAVQSVTGSETEPTPPDGGLGGASEPDFSLTDEEASQTFQRLTEKAHLAVENRDLSILHQIFTSDSPMKERTSRTIKRLRKDGVSDKSDFRSLSIKILSSQPDEIEILERVEVQPCYESDSGQDVTVGPRAFEYDARWDLRVENSTWLIHESAVQSEEEVTDEAKGSC